MSNNTYLDSLESLSIYIIREAYWEHKDNLAVLWSMGKDSTTLVHLIRKAFFGKAIIPAIHIDTSFKFEEIYRFREKYTKKWGINLIIAKNEEALKNGISPRKGRFDCCNILKTEALKQIIERKKFTALLVAIRKDEHTIRAKERYFSIRDKDFKWDYKNQAVELWAEYYNIKHVSGTHLRVHPMLHWREVDIWQYIKKEKLPILELYLSKNNKRYRSVGCECCCQPVDSPADNIDKVIKEIQNTQIKERSGRIQDKEKEYMMQKLRSLGYM